MSPRDRELLTGMGNCFAACGANFEETVGMVARARDRDPEEVRTTLARIRREYGTEPEYVALRGRLPAGFPF